LPTRSDRADLLLDTSAAISLVSPSASAHKSVIARTTGLRLGLAGHAVFETYSVLTRLPGGQRLSPAAAQRVIGVNFPASAMLAGADAETALDHLTRAGVAGGAVYDGLVGLAARGAGVTLLSCDRRATPVYAALGVAVEVV
jgi:hypothetical protein